MINLPITPGRSFNHKILPKLRINHWQNFLFVTILYVFTAGLIFLYFTTNYEPVEQLATVRLVILISFLPIILKFVIHFFIAPLYAVSEYFQSKHRQSEHIPSVSVLIPAWNEQVGIKNTIQSVIDTNYPKLEVVIVNDGSTDNTHKTVLKFMKTYVTENKSGIRIKYKSVPNKGKARALNVALAMAEGEIVVTLDADSVMHPDAIRNLMKYFNDPNVASVAGNVAIGNRSKPIGIIQQLEYLYGFYFKRADALMNAVYIVGGAAAAYRKCIVEEVGGFDETVITEDIELSTHLQDLEYKVRYTTYAIVFTKGPSDFRSLCSQRLRWKYGRLLTFLKYKHLFFSVHSGHNTYLSFVVLPIALFAEILLFFEGFLLTVFYFYTFYSHDFGPLVFVIVVQTGLIILQVISDSNKRYHCNLLLIAPVAWLLFYVMDFVEYQALIRSLWRLCKKQAPRWQQWSRNGVFEQSLKKSVLNS